MANITVLNTDAGLSGKTIVNTEDAQTVTGLKNFDRDPNPPFAVSANSAVVTNLDADKVDGIEGANIAKLDTANTFTNGPQTINAATAGKGNLTFKVGGTSKASFGLSGAIEGDSTTDASVFAETSGSIRFYTNGSAVEKWFISPNGGLMVGGIDPAAGAFGTIVLTNNAGIWSVNAAGSGIKEMLRLDTSDQTTIDANTAHLNIENAVTATSANAGTNGAVPAQVNGYWTIKLNGVVCKIPYYVE